MDEGRKEQRKGGGGVDADGQGDERHEADDPALKEGKAHQVWYLVLPGRVNYPRGSNRAGLSGVKAAFWFGRVSLAKHRMVIEHIFPDGDCLNCAKQYPRCLQIVRLHAQAHDLAHGRIAQQVIGNLDCDLHCDLGGAFVPFALVVVLPAIRAISKAAYFFGTVGSRPADVADPVCCFNIANRPLDVFVPDFLALALAEPPHPDALNIRKHRSPWSNFNNQSTGAPVRSLARCRESVAISRPNVKTNPSGGSRAFPPIR